MTAKEQFALSSAVIQEQKAVLASFYDYPSGAPGEDFVHEDSL